MKISLIAPIYNEEESINEFLKCISEIEPCIIEELGENGEIEIIFVNDGSEDNTRQLVEIASETNNKIKLINLSRNFGKEAALTAGLQNASGDAVIPIDIDLQDPPSVIIEMIKHWKSGAHVVNAYRANRHDDSSFKRFSANLFYAVLKKISDHPVHPNVGDFRLLDKKVVAALNKLSEKSRFNKGLFSWVGFNVVQIEFTRTNRYQGETKWNIRKLWALALDGIFSSSTLPLRIWTYIGAVIALFAFIYAAYLIIYTITTGGDVPGYASIMVAILFLGGLNMLSLGLMGEYIGRIAMEVRGRPLYIIESTRGFDNGK